MAELILKVGSNNPDDPTQAQDGDLMMAINRRRIRCVYAEHLCHPNLVERKSDGLRPVGCLTQRFYELIYQYRIERVSLREVKRTEISTGESILISNHSLIPGSPVLDVEDHIKKRMKDKLAVTFGVTGKEIWYSGRMKRDDATLNNVWQNIEDDTPERESDDKYARWPLSDIECRHYLPLPCDDFDDQTMQSLHQPEIETRLREPGTEASERAARGEISPYEEVLIAKRLNLIEYEELSQISAKMDIIRDYSKNSDLRLLVDPLSHSIDPHAKMVESQYKRQVIVDLP